MFGRDALVAAVHHASTASGVLVTSCAGVRSAVADSAVAPVSANAANAPIVLASVHHGSLVCDPVRRIRVFGVNLPSLEQASVADSFVKDGTALAPFDFARVAWQDVGDPASEPRAVRCPLRPPSRARRRHGYHPVEAPEHDTLHDPIGLLYIAEHHAAPQPMPNTMMEVPR